MKINHNNIYISHKSETCMGKNGTPLTEYRSYAEASRARRSCGREGFQR